MKKSLLLIVLLFVCTRLFAADYYWVGGNGSWSDFQHHWALQSGGTVFHPQVPSPTDNVFFDALSFPASNPQLTVDVASPACKDMTWNTGSQYIKIVSTVSNSALNVYGSLQLASGLQFINDFGIGMLASSGVHTYKNNGFVDYAYAYFSVGFNGANAQWQVSDSIVCDGLGLRNGQLIVNNKIIRSSSIYISGANSVLKMNTGKVYVDNFELYGISTHDLHGTVFTARGSVISQVQIDTLYTYGQNVFTLEALVYKAKIDNASVDLNSSTVQYWYGNAGKIHVKQNATIVNFTPNTLTGLKIDDNKTLTTSNVSLLGNDCGHVTSISGGTWRQTSGAVVLDYVQLKNTIYTGGATFTATHSVDLHGNTGISIIEKAPVTLYWIGGTGLWNDGNHWSLASGGTASGCIPTALDNVVFDAQSFTGAAPYTVKSTLVNYDRGDIYCADFDASNAPSFEIYANLYLYGSITLNEYLSYLNYNTSALSVNCMAFNGIHYIDANKSTAISALYVNTDGTYKLKDSLNTNLISMAKGTFNSNSYLVRAGVVRNNISSTESATLLMGSSVWYVSSAFTISSTDLGYGMLYVTPGTSHIYYTGSEFSVDTYQNLYNVTLAGYQDTPVRILSVANKVVVASSMYLGMEFQTDTLQVVSGYTLKLMGTGVITVVKLLANIPSLTGCETTTTIMCPDDGYTAAFYSTNADVELSNIIIENVTASGGADFFAANSVLKGNTAGWTYSAYVPKNLYWVGGGTAAAWDDPMHWARSSGGIPDGCDLPTESDNVYFDEHSTSGVTSIDLGSISRNVKSLHMISLTDSLKISGVGIYLNVWGDIELHRKTQLTDLMISLQGDQPATITSNGASIGGLEFLNEGHNTITDTLNVNGVWVRKGHTSFNGQVLNIDAFRIGERDSMIVDFTDAIINTNNLYISSDSLNFISTRAKLNLIISGYDAYLSMQYLNANKRISFDTIEVINQVYGYNQEGTVNIGSFNLDVDLLILNQMSDAYLSFDNSRINTLLVHSDNVRIDGYTSTIGYLQLESDYVDVTALNAGYVKLRPGTSIVFPVAVETIITEYLDAVGTSSLPITVRSSTLGSQATIRIASGTICAAYLYLRDSKAIGGATFIAGPSSSDISNNTGWNFITACVPVTATYALPLCSDNDLQLLVTAPPNVTGFLWNGPSSFITNTQNPIITDRSSLANGLYTLNAGGEIRKVYVDRVSDPDNTIYSVPGYIRHIDYPVIGQYNFDWYLNGTLITSTHLGELADPITGDYYAVITNANGCSVTSNTISFTDESTPGAPTLVYVAYDSVDDAVKLSWSDTNTTNVDYIIERSVGNSNSFVEVAYIYNGQLSYYDYDFQIGVHYYYRVKATYNLLTSGYSSMVDITVLSTAVANASSVGMELYPNPVQHSLTVESSRPIISVKVYNVMGVLMYKEKISGTSGILNLSSIEEGVYILEVEGADYTTRKRIQKIR